MSVWVRPHRLFYFYLLFMDKELHGVDWKGVDPIPLSLSQQTDFDGSVYYRASIHDKKTVDIRDLAERIVRARSQIRLETYIETFTSLKREIYNALIQGEKVDIGIGILSLSVKGRFDDESDNFDPARHAFHITFTPSPFARLMEQQLEGTNLMNQPPRQPYISNVCATFYSTDVGYQRDTVWTDSPQIHLFGKHIRIMGDHPDVGIRFYSETDEIVEIERQWITFNQRSHVTVTLLQPLAAGHWTAELTTQYNLSYQPYKTPRKATHDFIVRPRE